jgi:hypothetical protein
MSFQEGDGDWTEYRQLGNYLEVDLHPSTFSGYDEDGSWFNASDMPYWEKMDMVEDITLESLKEAQEKGVEYVIFTHGYSTSRPGQTTARSVVRSIMRDKISTPYIIRKKCIQHYSVFVAAIRPR